MGDSENSRTKSRAASASRGTSRERDRRAQAAGEGHLGQRDGQAPFAQVVAAPDQAARDRRVDGREARAGPARGRPGARGPPSC